MSLLDEPARGALDVDRVATRTVDGLDVDHVALAGVGEQGGEAGAVFRERPTADALVMKRLFEGADHGPALRFDGVTDSRGAEVR